MLIFTANCTQGWFAFGLLGPGLLTHQSFNWHILDTGYWFADCILASFILQVLKVRCDPPRLLSVSFLFRTSGKCESHSQAGSARTLHPPSHSSTTRLYNTFETVAMFMIVCSRCDKGPAFALLRQPPVSLLPKVIDVSNPPIGMDDSQNAIHRNCRLWWKGGQILFSRF